MTGLKLEDPTVDVNDIEKYRLAFLMQFFVQHRSRFRFPRLRLQDLYQRVIKDPEPTAFCDLVARILRFLNHGDPDICIDHVDQALDRFTVDKRTSYRIQMQRHRNGKPVHQLSAEARAALLENLIESVYDEQPDFNFTTTGFNSNNTATTTGVNPGLPSGCRPTATNNGTIGVDGSMSDTDGSGNLFGGPGNLTGFPEDGHLGDFGESDDENVLIIKAGQDAQGCSYYYMEDLRLYRERPQSGISSQWDVAVGPTANQWQAFIASLSRNEKEYDLYCFLQHDLFELVKESLVRYDLHEINDKLDTGYLRAKEANELSELRRLKGLGSTHASNPNAADDDVKFPMAGLGANGPKSASPAFSGGHGGGVGSAGSSASGAPLTPSSSVRTPTSAPPATTMLLSNGYLPPATTAPTVSSNTDPMDPHGLGKSETNVFTTRPNLANSQPSLSVSDTTQLDKTRTYSGEPNGETIPNAAIASNSAKLTDGHADQTRSPLLDSDNKMMMTSAAAESIQSVLQTKPSPSPVQDSNITAPDSAIPMSGDSVGMEPSHIERELSAALAESHAKPSPTSGTGNSGNIASWTSAGNRGPMGPSQKPDSHSLPTNKGFNDQPIEQSPFGTCPHSSVPSSVVDGTDTASMTHNLCSSQLVQPTTGSSNTQGSLCSTTATTKPSIYAFDPVTRTKGIPSVGGMGDVNTLQSNMVAVRPQGPVDHAQQPVVPTQPDDHQFPPGTVDCVGFGLGQVTKSHINPTTAMVSPMVGIPDATLTQEQWENRKTKIAKLEKIQSTLNRSKSASTPGAVAAAAGAVLQQQRFQGSVGVSGPGVPPPTSLAQSPGSITSHAMGVNTPVGFGSSPYVGSQRPGLVDPYCGGPRPVMMPGAPPSEMAQREWDRLCLDYQREKGEPPGPRFHPSCRPAMMYDPNGCPLISTDSATPPPLGAVPPSTMMMMPSQVMMDHTANCGPNMRHFGPQMDGSGLGPPVVMVPPNNTNLTSTNSGYPLPPSASGLMGPVPPGQHFRPVPGGYVCTDQSVPMGMVPQSGYKRAYHGTAVGANDPWAGPGITHPMLSQVSMNEAAMFPTGSIPSGQRIGPMAGSGIGSPPPPMGGPGIPVSISPASNIVTTIGGITTNSNTTNSSSGVGSRTSSGISKAGGKKRKTTAAANRAAAAAAAAATNNNTSPVATVASAVPQPTTPYGKQLSHAGSMTPNKPSYLMSPYMADNSSLTGLPPHPHRPPIYMSQTALSNHSQQQSPCSISHYPSGATDPYFAHYPDMAGASQPIGRSMGPITPSGPEGRRALTPKGTDVFTVGGPNGNSGMTSGRMPPSNCQIGFSTNPGGCPNSSSMIHPYLQSPEGPIPSSNDPVTGIRSTGSYTTQHLTSASLASLARLSQMSGPEGPPYAPGSSSNAGAGGGGPLSSTLPTAYSSRGNPMLAYQHQLDGTNSGLPPLTSHQLPPSQLMRNHSMSGGLKSQLNHEQQQPDQSINVNPSTVLPQSNPGMHQKFGAQGYHSQQSLPTAMMSATPMQQPQPPSIQVNNTFFNAQLNVQQMNYQHVSAPGSTGQMQIHFVQQQQQNQQPQQQPVPPSHDQSSSANTTTSHRTSRALDPNSRLSSVCTTATAASTATTTTMSSTTTSSAGQDYYQPDSSMTQHRFLPNYPNEMSAKSDQLSCSALPNSNSGGPPVSGYGNTSIQITPKTPHTIQYLPNPITQNPTTDNNAQYTAAIANRPGRMSNLSLVSTNSNNQNNNMHCLGSSYQSDPDAEPTGASVRQAAASVSNLSFNSGHMYPSHHQPPAQQSQPPQQQQYSQPVTNLPPRTYNQAQPTGSMKMVSSQQQPQQQLSSSLATIPTGPWSTAVTDSPPFESNHPGPMPVSFCGGMEPNYSIQGSRVAGGPGHPSMKMMNASCTPANYAPNSLNFSSDPMIEHMPPGFMSDPMSMNRGSSSSAAAAAAGGSGHSAQYGRSQSSGRHPMYDQAPPQQQQQHVYRQQQQQYNHTQSSQQQQQQQMLMSSNYISEGLAGPGGQLQFMMSASSSAAMSSNSNTSCSSTTTVQTNNNCSNGLMNQQDNTTVGMTNQSVGEAKQANYEHAKRAHMMMMASGSDDLKIGQMGNAVAFSNPACSQQQPHMMMQSQLGPGRTSSGRPLSNTGNPPMNMMDVHFTASGGGSYHHPSGGSFVSGSGFSQSLGSMPMGGGYGTDKMTTTSGREMLSASQSAAGAICDISSANATGLSQLTYQSPMIQ